MHEKPGPLSKQIKSKSENLTGVTIFDKSEPRSVYNLVSPIMQEAIENVDPTFFDFAFKTIERNLNPEVRDYQLRIAFWREYYESQDNWRRSISLNAITKGVCTQKYLYEDVFKDPLRLAFILYPVTDLAVAMHEMEDLGLREMRKILVMPNTGKKGHNLAVIREKIKIFALIQNRNRGSIMQRVQSHTRTENFHIHAKTQEAPKSLAEIQKEIRKIELTSSSIKNVECLEGETTNPKDTPQAVEDSMPKQEKDIDG